MLKNIFRITLFIISLPALAEKPEGVWAWQEDDIAEQILVLEKGRDHPCGQTHKIAIEKMPDVSNAKSMGFEKVAEYSRNKVINRWVVPVDSTPLSIDDENLILTHSYDSLLINIHGFFSIVNKKDDETTLLDRCPRFLDKEFNHYDKIRCVKLLDKRANKTRYLAYRGSCI